MSEPIEDSGACIAFVISVEIEGIEVEGYKGVRDPEREGVEAADSKGRRRGKMLKLSISKSSIIDSKASASTKLVIVQPKLA
jgi:hypothetical protein